MLDSTSSAGYLTPRPYSSDWLTMAMWITWLLPCHYRMVQFNRSASLQKPSTGYHHPLSKYRSTAHGIDSGLSLSRCGCPSLAQSYLGRITGPKVLAGDFSRGNTQLMNAGILFCDIRGFTRLSQELGASGVVSVVNQIFDVVGNAVKENDGEILKFIGDAVLIVFADDEGGSRTKMVNSMLSDSSNRG